MDKIIEGFLSRNLPDFKNSFEVNISKAQTDYYKIFCRDNTIVVTASDYVCAFHGIYEYLKNKCGVNLSWCGNKKIALKELTYFSGEMNKIIPQKYRVYMNYCTLDYTMCWWDFSRWEKEIDFMAMNGINMPLAVVGSEAVLYETLLEYGFSRDEALKEISGPAFWAWQLMTNIMGYLPPKDESYVYSRAELGRKILARYLEFGMYPIQQGFSGHVPTAMKDKFPNAKILLQKGWCYYPETAQLDPLDPLFLQFGTSYLKNLQKLFGCYHFIACDPFHEGTPPKKSRRYLRGVGKTINKLYEDFDKDSVWVMQAWTMRKHVVKAVPKDRLLTLDLNSDRTFKNKKMWGYNVVAGMLHNFGGKNAMQGKLRHHSHNTWLTFRQKGAQVVGSGMFMEGIEQNPVVYDLQFRLLTESGVLDFDAWLDDYITRRYGEYSSEMRKAWDILLKTCYRDDGYEENEVGSTLASRPQLMPVRSGPCCYSKVYYDCSEFEKAVKIFLSLADKFGDNDGYQYDLCDVVRQALSNRFYTNQKLYAESYGKKNIDEVKDIAAKQLDILCDLDELTSHRSEMCLSRWICDSHKLAQNEEEKRYFDMNARTLITSWGDINGETSALYDYSWREWSGLIKEYYYKRWEMFYDYAQQCLEKGKKLDIINGNDYPSRRKYKSYEFGKKLDEFELSWCKEYSEYPEPCDRDVIPFAAEMVEKWNIG